MDIITLAQGSGGEESNKLIEEVFYKYFNNEILLQKNDSSILKDIKGAIAITTDSFVVNPIFFKGGDIGKLSICGTVNDLAVSGATPLYLTASFIIEEGFEIEKLKKVVESMSITARAAGIKVVAGDTKVVEKGRAHNLYINTTGIGVIEDDDYIPDVKNIKAGDKIILSGNIGDHGMCIMNEREYLQVDGELKSDCALLNTLTRNILKSSKKVRIMRDPTRGGVATTLNEIIDMCGKSMVIYEEHIPVKAEVMDFCEMLGIDPLYVANEGKLICIVDSEDAEGVLKAIKENDLGKNCVIIGEVIEENSNKLYMKTNLGATKILPVAQGELLPRIC